MNLEDFGRVAAASLLSIEKLLGDWFPKGVREGLEFCIGSSSGEAGQSLRIRLEGEKAGNWGDFAAGDAGGDLISLYAYIHGISQGKACVALAGQLGVALTPTPGFKGKPNTVPPVLQKQPPERAPAQAAQGVEEVPAKKKKPSTPWEPVMPIPESAGDYPLAHPVRGRSDRHWTYIDDQGRPIGYVHRFTKSDGSKTVIPCVYAKHPVTGRCDWRWIHFREPKPLYFRRPLDPALIKVVVEGEKCADAGFELLGDYYDVLSWAGGAPSAPKADWARLQGSTVILWADADAHTYKAKQGAQPHPKEGQIKPEDEQTGMVTMRKVADILRNQYECTVHFVDIPAPGVKPDGWDIADMIADGADQAEVLAFLESFRPTTEAKMDPVGAEDMPQADVPPGADLEDDIPPNFPDDEGSFTPPPAGAKAMTRAAIRAMMIGTSSGGIKGCRENVYIAMKHDACLIGLVALDQFALLQVKRRDPPWLSDKGEWNEGDDFQLGIYLANYYGLLIAAMGDIEKAVAQIARENGFNPVVDLFDACAKNWDGQPRIDAAFSTYWGAKASPYLAAVARMFFIGLAKRVYVPGVKNDYAPVFEGGQGEGKSTTLSILGGEWFADTPFRMGEKDSFLSIQGILIYEIAELEQFNRSEVTAVKAFMSSQKDRYREPYGRRMKNQLRRTVFAGSTNEGQYFKDTTGNRRFWPVITGRLDLDGLRRDREQLFGEAVHRMNAGEKWYPTKDEQNYLINPEQESREIWDEWSGAVWDYLEAEDPTQFIVTGTKQRNRVTARELLTKALGFEIHKISNSKTETMRISAIMRKYGWIKGRKTDGSREYYYDRPAAVENDVEGQGGDDEPIPF